MIIFDV